MIKILFVSSVPPGIKNYATILFENLLHLRNKIEIQLTWLVTSPTRIDLSAQNNSEITILDFNDYNNALEVVKEVKPDLIYSQPAFSPTDYAFLLAGKFLGVPVIGGEIRSSPSPLYQPSNPRRIIRSQISQLFQRNIPGSVTQEKKLIMGRGRFYICKYFFLIRTQQAMRMKKLQMFREFLLDFRRLVLIVKSYEKPNLRFSCDLNFLDGETRVEEFIKSGYKRSSLIVTGNPTYDSIFQRLEKFKLATSKDKIRILLVTTNPSDSGGNRTRKLRDYWIKSIVTEISKYKNEMSLVVKIHPSGEVLSEYQLLVSSIDPSVKVYQQGDIIEFLESSDVVIGWSANTALVLSLIARRPIIIWNIFEVKGDMFLEKGLAIECKGPESVIESIYHSLSSNPASEEKVNEFINQYFYKFDGKATERIANVISDFLKERDKMVTKTY